jgi:hypothetical protein
MLGLGGVDTAGSASTPPGIRSLASCQVAALQPTRTRAAFVRLVSGRVTIAVATNHIARFRWDT